MYKRGTGTSLFINHLGPKDATFEIVSKRQTTAEKISGKDGCSAPYSLREKGTLLGDRALKTACQQRKID